MTKRPFKRKVKRKRHGATFWDHEYANDGGHLKLSEAPSGDMLKFLRWLERQNEQALLSKTAKAVDFGCGNGRNLIHLGETYGMSGFGFDISAAAIKIAKNASKELDIHYETRSIGGVFPTIPDNSQALVLDMMTSHFLTEAQRTVLRDEMFRVLQPGGYLFLKTHLGDGDLHTKRLFAEAPGKEHNTYIHPVMGVPEHVYFEDELVVFLEEKFEIKKIYRSHKHISHGRARKRRTISVYAQKPLF